jgi:hypothetical protein
VAAILFSGVVLVVKQENPDIGDYPIQSNFKYESREV